MNVQITQANIDQGKKFESNQCPLALALERELGYTVMVGAYDVYVDTRVAYVLSPEASVWTLEFDLGDVVKPIILHILPV